MNDRDVWVVSGIPGSGKTTVARLLAAQYHRGVHIEGDLVGHNFIVSGLVPPHQEPKEEAESQLQLRRRNISFLASSFIQAGFSVVVDDVVVSGSVLDHYLQTLPSPLRFVQLCPTLDVVAARDAARDKHFFHIWGHLQQELETMQKVGLWIDTSALTPEDTAEAIRQRADDAVVGGPYN